MTTLIAEDLLLLLLDDEKGSMTAWDPTPALGGAVLIELALLGAVEVTTKPTRVAAVAGVRVDDPVLRDALDTVSERRRSPQDLVQRLGKGVMAVLAERLAERGMLERREDKILGLFPRTRWPAADPSHEEAVRADLTRVLVRGEEPDERTAALIALLAAIDRVHKVVADPAVSGREVRKRAKAIAEGAWAATAVRQAIQASMAAIMTATMAATAASSASNS